MSGLTKIRESSLKPKAETFALLRFTTESRYKYDNICISYLIAIAKKYIIYSYIHLHSYMYIYIFIYTSMRHHGWRAKAWYHTMSGWWWTSALKSQIVDSIHQLTCYSLWFLKQKLSGYFGSSNVTKATPLHSSWGVPSIWDCRHFTACLSGIRLPVCPNSILFVKHLGQELQQYTEDNM